MKTFNDIKSEWGEQKESETPKNGASKIIEETIKIKNKQWITNLILGSTVLLLIGFFFYIKAYLVTKVTLALALMILSLVIRIVMELLSILRLKKIKFQDSTVSFKENLMTYYKRRLNTHYIFTPIILVAYIIGFLTLLPYFKESLSSGFYTYIIVSGLLILIIGLFLMYKKIRQELNALRNLI